MNFLPTRVRTEIETLARGGSVSEIYLRAGRASSVTVDGENRLLASRFETDELEGMVTLFCGGSVYAYRDRLCEGSLTLTGGVRVGVVGRATTESGRISSVTGITSLCIRIPHRVPGLADEVYRTWLAGGARRGILVIAPPSGGKTTFLREFIIAASSGSEARRVAVVDSREELCPANEGTLAEVLRGYPRGAGMEIALRTLAPEVLVCDEVTASALEALEETAYSGVPLVASMHGTSVEEVLRRPGVRPLLEGGLFGYAVVISGRGNGRRVRPEELPW